MDPEEILFQPSIISTICLNSTRKDARHLLKAYNRTEIVCAIPIVDRTSLKVYYLPGINQTTLQILELTRSFGLEYIFFQAVEREENEIVSTLLQMGVNINAQNRFGDTALILAINQGNESITSLLLNYQADVNITDYTNFSTLYLAVDRNQPEIISRLLEFGANVNHQNNNGDTALHLAKRQQSEKIIQILLEAKANPDLVNLAGHTAFSPNNHYPQII